jgi:ankyrin repeat protein
MKPKPFNPDETPYPRLGEVVHFIVHAFVGNGDDLRKRLKRFATESDFNLAAANQLIDDVLLKPLKKVDAKFAGNMQEWLTQLLDDYKTLVLTVPTETAERDVVLKTLAGVFLMPSITVFLKNFQKQCPDSPKLEQWFKSTDTIAVKEVLSWWMQTYEVSENTLVDFLNPYDPKNGRYEDYKETLSRNLRRWKSGETLPDESSLLNFKQIKRTGKPQKGLTNLVIWLLLARAWQYTCQNVVKRFGEEELTPFISVVNNTYQKALGEFKAENKFKAEELVRFALLDAINLLNGMDELHKSFFEDCFMPFQKISLQREKTAGDEKQAQTTLKGFEQHPFFPHYRHFSEQGWGRYYAMCCEYEQALEHYQKAFEHGAYRAGEHLLSILQELLTLAAFLGKKEIINRHYRWACAMGLFSENRNGKPEDWEIKQFKMAFVKRFPSQGLYQCADQQKKTEMEQKRKKVFSLAFSSSESEKKWANTPPDLRNPNRRVKDFSIKPFPQLMVFINLGQNDKVKLLLEKGADPNSRLSDNATALIIALQSNNTEAAELLLQHPALKTETINAKTQRKKFTALQWAIDKGYVDIIRLLIEKGADIEQSCYISELSPLYYTLAQFNHTKNTKTIGFSRVPKENKLPDNDRRISEYLEVLGSGAVLEQDFSDFQAMQTPEFKAIAEMVIPRFNLELSTFLQIIDVLLEAGADVNKRHSYSNFTPFLFSAEVGDLEIFRRLYEAGGNLTDCLDNGGSILSIALAYSNFNIAAYILEHGDKEQLRQIINAQNDSKGFTALYHFIIQFKELKRRRLYSEETMSAWRELVWDKLLALEPDLTLKDNNGLTAEELADRYGMPSFALELHKRRKGV